MIYKVLEREEITKKFFQGFIRHQVVTDCYRRDGDGWKIEYDPFIDEWSEKEKEEILEDLRKISQREGYVMGAFEGEYLKGFVAVDGVFFGSQKQYLDLIHICVSEEMRGKGIGKILFHSAADWAKTKGALKLYLSAHSAVESQKFYRGMGCIDAIEPDEGHVEKEPWDCQLEYKL